MNTYKVNLVALATFALLGISCMYQHIPTETAEVISSPNQTQQVLYKRVRQLFSYYFQHGSDAFLVVYDDPKAGIIIGRGGAKLILNPSSEVYYEAIYQIRVDTNNGRFKITSKVLSYIRHKKSDELYSRDMTSVSKEREELAYRYIANLSDNIKRYVANPRSEASPKM